MSVFAILMFLQASSPVEETGKSADPVICRKYVETGSLIRKKKVCRTRSEWIKANSELNESMNRFVEERRGRPPGGN
jgi:hypothetical protein